MPCYNHPEVDNRWINFYSVTVNRLTILVCKGSFQMKNAGFFVFTALVVVLGSYVTLSAFQNVCNSCNALAKLVDTHCKHCSEPLNKCLSCGTENQVAKNYCQKCYEPLAEMRLLGSIDPETRSKLRLGKSPRAVLERELQTIDHLLTIQPENEEVFLFRKAKIFQEMKFASRAANAWRHFLEKHPESEKVGTAKIYLSEALRHWGYLYYQQKNTKMALRRFEQATEANPANVEAWLWLGRLQNESGNNAESRKAYQKALELDKNNTTARHFLRRMR